MTTDYVALDRSLDRSLRLDVPPIAVCLTDEVPAGVPAFTGRAPAGCAFWQEAAKAAFVTSARDHDLCAIGTFTHNLDATAAHDADRRDALRVFADLGYVRPQDIPLIPVLAKRHRHVVYAPLAATPMPPDVVILFVRAAQTLVLVEAAEGVAGGRPPAMGRPACAVVPHVVNHRTAALSLGCCGARAYLDVLTDDVAIFALPGDRLDAYVARITELAKANSVLATFHALRRRDVEAGGSPTVKQSLERLSAR